MSLMSEENMFGKSQQSDKIVYLFFNILFLIQGKFHYNLKMIFR